MGCDIHCYAERKSKDGKWEIVGNVKKEEDGWVSIDYEPYHDRNYNLFAILANVRNGTAFAGCKTGEGFNSISNPKGVPSDASEEYASLSEQYDSDGHSHSYFTLRELLDYDWTQTTQLQGWVDMVTWEKFSLYGKKDFPQNYCGMISGNSIEHISEEEADKLFEGLSRKERIEVAKLHTNKYALAKWTIKYSQCVDSFLSDTITELLKLAGGTKGIDDIRIVFFFDN